jgi:hypothetical protein
MLKNLSPSEIKYVVEEPVGSPFKWKIKLTSVFRSRFVEEGVAQNIRVDGRGRLDYRPFSLETGIVTQANGSCRHDSILHLIHFLIRRFPPLFRVI